MAEDLLMGERLAVLETKVDDIQKNVSEVKADVKALTNCMNDFKDSADKTYANKQDVEKQLDSMNNKIWWVVTAFIGLIIVLKIFNVL